MDVPCLRFLDGLPASVVVRDTKPNQLAIGPVRRSAVVCCVFRRKSATGWPPITVQELDIQYSLAPTALRP